MSLHDNGAVAAAAEHQAEIDAAQSRKSWGETLSRRRIVLVLDQRHARHAALGARPDDRRHRPAEDRRRPSPTASQHYVWVTTGYLLATAASMPIWGKLSDAYGRKRFYAVGMIIFVVGSAP